MCFFLPFVILPSSTQFEEGLRSFCVLFHQHPLQTMDSRGGTSKGGGKRTSGGGSIKITKSKAMQTKQIEERIIHLRRAIFNDDGRGKCRHIAQCNILSYTLYHIHSYNDIRIFSYACANVANSLTHTV